MTWMNQPELWFNGGTIYYADGSEETLTYPHVLELGDVGLVIRSQNGMNQGTRFVPWIQVRELVRG